MIYTLEICYASNIDRLSREASVVQGNLGIDRNRLRFSRLILKPLINGPVSAEA